MVIYLKFEGFFCKMTGTGRPTGQSDSRKLLVTWPPASFWCVNYIEEMSDVLVQAFPNKEEEK